ncbi:hypothetical protein [Chryseobacterium indologenes]|nr:hypothetical protein [Chryseobacterium indologenes]
MAVGNGKLTFTISSTAYGIAVPLGSSFSVNGGGENCRIDFPVKERTIEN